MVIARVQDSDACHLTQFVNSSDESAFTCLVERYKNLVYRTCFSVLRNESDAEDAAQATFIVLFKKADTIRDIRCLPAWLHRVAIDIARNLRKSKASRTNRERFVAETRASERTTVPNSDEKRDDLCTNLQLQLNGLAEKYREVFVLHYLCGLSHTEISQKLNLSLSAVNMRLTRARKKISERIRKTDRNIAWSALVPLFSFYAMPEIPLPAGERIIEDIKNPSNSTKAHELYDAMLQTWPCEQLCYLKYGLACIALVVITATIVAFSGSQNKTTDHAALRLDEVHREILLIDGSAWKIDARSDSSISEEKIHPGQRVESGQKIITKAQDATFEAPNFILTLARDTEVVLSPDGEVNLVAGYIEVKIPLRHAPLNILTEHARLSGTGQLELRVMATAQYTRVDNIAGHIIFEAIKSTERKKLASREAVAWVDNSGMMAPRFTEYRFDPRYSGIYYRETGIAYFDRRQTMGKTRTVSKSDVNGLAPNKIVLNAMQLYKLAQQSGTPLSALRLANNKVGKKVLQFKPNIADQVFKLAIKLPYVEIVQLTWDIDSIAGSVIYSVDSQQTIELPISPGDIAKKLQTTPADRKFQIDLFKVGEYPSGMSLFERQLPDGQTALLVMNEREELRLQLQFRDNSGFIEINGVSIHSN